jgi:hypothetical protein
MTKNTSLCTIFGGVLITLLLSINFTSIALCQSSSNQGNTQKESVLFSSSLSSRFSIEGSLGFMFSDGQNPRGLMWINRLIRDPYADIEIGMRFPLSDNAVWYTGLQGTVYDDSYRPTILLGGGWQTGSTQGKIVAHGGIEYSLGSGLRMRSTLGAGMLWGDLLTRTTIATPEIETRSSVKSFTMSIRQNLLYDINNMLSTGIKFEQTFSQYDNFFSAGLVFGVRF